MFFSGRTFLSPGPCGAPPCSPKAKTTQDPIVNLQQESNDFTADSVQVENTVYVADAQAERRVPIAEAILNFRMAHEEVQAHRGASWSFESIQPVNHLNQDLVSKDLFKHVKQAPLSLLQLPLQSDPLVSSLLPHAATTRQELPHRSRSSAVTATDPIVPPLKHMHLFAAAVNTCSPRARHAIATRIEECNNASRELSKGRETTGALLSSRVLDPHAVLEACSGHQPLPLGEHPQKLSISQFDFRLPHFSSLHFSLM
jgi:hypothetical protein